MVLFDLFIGVGTFLLPGIFTLAFIGRQLRHGFSINDEPLSGPDPILLSFASITLWCNLLYFARMYESTGFYVIMFRNFGNTLNYIILVVVFMLIGSDFFRIVGGSNSKIDPETGNPYDAPFSNALVSLKFTLNSGLLAQDDTSPLLDSDSKQLLFGVWFIISLIVAIILLNLLIGVITKVFEDVQQTQVESNQLAKA